MRNARNAGMFGLVTLIGIAIFSVFFNSEAQRRESVRIFTPGYYYVDEDSTSQNAQTSLITLSVSDFARLNNYPTGLQVVFKTEEDNSETAAVTLKIGSLPAKRLLTRHGQEFELLELDNGVILTATYDGDAFISDYTAARSLKGRLIASVDIAAGNYELFQYIEGWTIASGVTEVGTATLPAAAQFLGNSVDRPNALITLPTDRLKGSQLGWYFEVLNGTTVVNTFFRNFGTSAALSSSISTDNAGISFFEQNHGSGRFTGITESTMGFIFSPAATIPAGYSIKMYLSEN